MYDKLMSNSICVTGMLLLTDLAEKLEPYCTILQKNTDGIYMKVEKEEDIQVVQSIAKEWEERTRLNLEWDRYSRIIQKDVNSYILVAEDGHYKSKGAYTKKLSDVDYDLAIINKAIVDYFTKDIPVEDTINNCNELRDFQKVVKLKSPYKRALKNCTFSIPKVLNPKTGRMINGKKTYDENGIQLQDKTFRVFASLREDDGGLFKQKEGKNPEQFANTPNKCFIDNGKVLGKSVTDYLDRQWYIDLAQKRVNQYLGISNKKKKSTTNKK